MNLIQKSILLLATAISLAILVESPQVDSQMATSVDFEMNVLSNRDHDVVVPIRACASL